MNLARIITTKHDYARILACKNVRAASILAQNSRSSRLKPGSKYYVFRREAAIWNMIAALAKCNCNSSRPEILFERDAEKHAPQGLRRQYLREAKQRWEALQKWVERHPKQAEKECAPLIAEYEERAKRREARKQEVEKCIV